MPARPGCAAAGAPPAAPLDLSRLVLALVELRFVLFLLLGDPKKTHAVPVQQPLALLQPRDPLLEALGGMYSGIGGGGGDDGRREGRDGRVDIVKR